jgi:hypothetical protein
VTDIDKITSRPSEYLAETGVPQFVGGAGIFLLGSGVLIQHVLPKGFMAEIPEWIAICCAGAALLGARALMQRIVYPRGGYVEPRARPVVMFINVVYGAVLTALAIFPIAWPGRLPHERLVEPGFAIVFAIECLVYGWKRKSTSMMWFGVYLAAIAPMLWIPERCDERFAWLEVAAGPPLAVIGAIRLRRFIKANPRPVETTNE